MPTIRVQGCFNSEIKVENILNKITSYASEALAIPADYCWALFENQPHGTFVEGNRIVSPAQGNVIIASVAALEGRTMQQKSAVMNAVSRAIVEGAGLSASQVFIEYRDIPKGQAFSAGETL
ncbi:tautomerase family protein [Marinobacterium jannaschii]|uniref:tautomerase family protein n=1 Tax=Marinobacterium jannaschii TaxID=64970 RepID=UPI0005631DA7|nr:tautomerase family protein [Marinobacterium jannaschii]